MFSTRRVPATLQVQEEGDSAAVHIWRSYGCVFHAPVYASAAEVGVRTPTGEVRSAGALPFFTV